MRPSTSVLVPVAVVLLVNSATGFVQAPARCAMTHQAAGRSSSSSSSRTSLQRQQQRPRPFAPHTRLFSEGEDGSSSSSGPVASAESSGEVGGEGGEGAAAAAAVAEEKEAKPLTMAERAQKAKMEEIQRLRSAEKFVTVQTGEFECLQCSFVYKPDEGGQGALQGTQFEDLPSTWVCPVCKAPKSTFEAQTKTIAGFEENANYGFGTNQMTGSQKNLLIFGGLAAFFVLFLAGYALE